MSSNNNEPWLSAIKNDPRSEEQMLADYERQIVALKEPRATQPKRPVAFRVPRADPSMAGEMLGVEWRLFQDEGAARDEADALGVEYQGLYVRDGS